MDCFYAAIEMRERPELGNVPLAVGGGSRRGVVTTCNYEARKFGVRSAMAGFKARELCPGLIFLPVRFDLYRAESAKIREILLSYTPLVEPLSLDEAFLDVTAMGRYAWDIAKEIRGRILRETALTSSAGVAPNKMLAKIASEWRKPAGQFAIRPEEVEAFMRTLPVRKIWGVGPKSAERFARMGIQTCGDLQKFTPVELAAVWGRWGEELYHLCRGHDDRAVNPNRIRKSLSNERTYLENLGTLAECRAALEALVDELHEELRTKASDRRIRKVFIRIKLADFTRFSKERICAFPAGEIFQDLLTEAYRAGQPVRLLGAGVRFAETEQGGEGSQPFLPLGPDSAAFSGGEGAE